MVNMKKRWIQFVAFVLVALFLTESAAVHCVAVEASGTARTVASGEFDNGLQWLLDSDGKLTISGNGPMPDFGYYVPENGNDDDLTYRWPLWNEYRDKVKKVIISEGITRVGSNSFGSQFANAAFSNIREISIAQSVTSIGSMAFCECQALTSVYFYGNAPLISEDTFAGSVSHATLYYVDGTSGWSGTSWKAFTKRTWMPGNVIKSGFDNFKVTRPYSNMTFSDVPSGAWYDSALKIAYEYGLINGTGNGKFNPNGNITLAATIALSARIRKMYNGDGSQFTKTNPWYATYLEYAIRNGIVGKNEYNNYNRAATRAEFADIMSKSLPENEFYAINSISDNSLPDIATGSQHGQAVYLLYNAGVLTGNDKYGTFTPNSSIRRNAVAAIIARIVDPSLRKTFTLAVRDNTSEDNQNDSSGKDTIWKSTSYDGYKISYEAGITAPETYHKRANAIAKQYLKFPAMAKEAKDRTVIVSYDKDNPNDITVGGWWLACNAFGVYDYVAYVAAFYNGNLSDYWCFVY